MTEIERRRDELHRKIQLRQQEMASGKGELARLRHESIKASADGEANAERLQDRYERAIRDLRTKEEAVRLLQDDLSAVELQYQEWTATIEDTDRRVRSAYEEFRQQHVVFIQALEEFIRHYDPLALQVAMQEVHRAEGAAAMRMGRHMTGNSRTELLFVDRPLLWEATSALAQYQVVNQLMMR
ncbi:hypothetical protein BH23GEM9_BH23GEM9_13870 [soil metagenome]